MDSDNQTAAHSAIRRLSRRIEQAPRVHYRQPGLSFAQAKAIFGRWWRLRTRQDGPA